MNPQELEDRIRAASGGVTVNHNHSRECERVGLRKAAAFYRENARSCSAEVARLVAMRTPETVARMEHERNLA